ncbi:hypothetical protein B0H15DRAFT_1020558 [Mycena belliarum]|uniref:F-box domain-containing protein n=1 Tax=Mycena belliarum TaxID=1033014 RepID=A0AAD6U935_9AGAR|nr:hypothetical protein B0H15DRAFT_1020558 [Mycena belliae]
MCDSLPDEILSEILSPALKIPDKMFANTLEISGFASYRRVSSSATLLVCKSWLRVATPLLYSTVVIRSKPQAQALQAALAEHPELGRFVKKLRVEGGFGKLMLQILKNTPNVRDLAVSLLLPSSDLPSGLKSGLPLINPTRLIVIDGTHPFSKLRMNKGITDLTATLILCCGKWSNIKMLLLPYDRRIDLRWNFVRDICASPTIRILSFPMYIKTPFDNASHGDSPFAYLVELGNNTSLDAIEIRTNSAQQQTSPLFSKDAHLNQLLRWADTSADQLLCSVKPLTCLPSDPSFQPMSSASLSVVEYIWSRILFFAMLSVEQCPGKTVEWIAPDLKTNSDRLQFLHLYSPLTLPY